MPRDGEIGRESVRVKGAMNRSIPTAQTPPSPNIGSEKVRRKQAGPCSQPIPAAPVFSNIGCVAASGDDGATPKAIPKTSPPHVANIVEQLVALQRRRVFSQVQKSRADRSIESMIASTMGFRIDATEKERKAVFARAKAHRLAVERAGEGHILDHPPGTSALSAIAPLILASAGNRKVWDTLCASAVTEMRALAKSLPAYPWAKAVRGFGELGLTVISAEAGIPVGDYRTVSGLWKRMGLAVIDGERQRRKTNKEAAIAHGYSPKRRAQIWTLAASMFKHQWHGADEENGIDAGPSGPYGEIYGRRRAWTKPRIEATADLASGDPLKWTARRCDNDARRIMTKALLRDLWVEWRRAA